MFNAILSKVDLTRNGRQQKTLLLRGQQ